LFRDDDGMIAPDQARSREIAPIEANAWLCDSTSLPSPFWVSSD